MESPQYSFSSVRLIRKPLLLSVLIAHQALRLQGMFFTIKLSVNFQFQRQTYSFLFLFIFFRAFHRRSEGVEPNSCPASHPEFVSRRHINLCYPKCRSGYRGKGNDCVKIERRDYFFMEKCCSQIWELKTLNKINGSCFGFYLPV